MANKPSTTTITVITCHGTYKGVECKKTNPGWKRCNCAKSLYIYENGKRTYVSAKTRSWERAERVAQAEREKRDPVRIELARIAKKEAQEVNLQKSKNITLPVATDRWVRGRKIEGRANLRIYLRAAWRIEQWAADEKIVNVTDITADGLEKWRGMWGPKAEKRYNRIAVATQSQFQSKVRRFFRWCVGTGNLSRDPTLLPLPINKGRKSRKQTQPLTSEQFEKLLDTIEPAMSVAIGEAREFAKELRALFLTQRWAGLRILDVLMLPRTALVGNRLSLTTKKTCAKIENRTLPESVVEALQALSPDRPLFKPGYFFWSKKKRWDCLSSKWDAVIKPMNELLAFKDDNGQPLTFKSHMLRDTFAVECLLDGMSMEDVSKLLNHESVKTTEEYYAPRVKSRLQHLDDMMVAAMRRMGAAVTA
jgi:integrase